MSEMPVMYQYNIVDVSGAGWREPGAVTRMYGSEPLDEEQLDRLGKDIRSRIEKESASRKRIAEIVIEEGNRLGLGTLDEVCKGRHENVHF